MLSSRLDINEETIRKLDLKKKNILNRERDKQMDTIKRLGNNGVRIKV